MENPYRNEVSIPLGGQKFTVRPTLDLMCRLESRFGPAASIARKLLRQEATLHEIGEMVFMVVGEEADAPDTQDEVLEAVFDHGYIEILPPLSKLIAQGMQGTASPRPKKEGERRSPGGKMSKKKRAE